MSVNKKTPIVFFILNWQVSDSLAQSEDIKMLKKESMRADVYLHIINLSVLHMIDFCLKINRFTFIMRHKYNSFVFQMLC